MRHKSDFIGIVFLGAVAFVSFTTGLALWEKGIAKEYPPTIRGGELQRVPGSKVKLAYVRPGTNWSKYKTIQLRTLDVPPDARDAKPKGQHARFTESYMLGDKEVAALQGAYAESMKKVLGDAGFTFVDTPKDDTLIIAAKITQIRLTAPVESTRLGYSGRSRTYSQGGGSISIAAVLADGQNNEVIAEAADAREPSNNLWRINNRVTNMADAKQIFSTWARYLKDALGR
jgi:hypothetical protein